MFLYFGLVAVGLYILTFVTLTRGLGWSWSATLVLGFVIIVLPGVIVVEFVERNTSSLTMEVVLGLVVAGPHLILFALAKALYNRVQRMEHK